MPVMKIIPMTGILGAKVTNYFDIKQISGKNPFKFRSRGSAKLRARSLKFRGRRGLEILRDVSL